MEKTHLERTKELFAEMGATFVQEKQNIRGNEVYCLDTNESTEIPSVDLNMGYSGFNCCMYFNMDGSFKGMGAWE